MKIEGVEIANPNNYGGMCSRAVALPSGAKDFQKGIDTVATTENPALIIDWERYQVVREILPMKYAQMPDNDKAPLLDTHSRWSIEQIKGSAKNWVVSETELLCKCFIASSEIDVRSKIEEGHIDSVSIGYQTNKNQTVEIPKGKTVTVEGRAFKNDFDDGYPMLVRTWWKTRELSLVPIGADDAAKLKSLHAQEQKQLLEKLEELQREIDDLKGKNIKSKAFYQRRLQLINSKLKHA